jgi:hypothetical protein
MADAEKELASISEFLSKLDLQASSKVLSDERAKDLYRKFHALLCWQKVFDEVKELKASGAFDEFLSDAAAAYFLHLTSAYKPSVSMLRSSVENVIRTLLIVEGINTKEIEAVWELFAVARAHFLKRGMDVIVLRIDALHGRYGEMCKTVHSAAPEYMSLRVPFERIFEAEHEKFVITQKLLTDVFRISAEALYLSRGGNLGTLHHRLADEIRDGLSPSTKALIN